MKLLASYIFHRKIMAIIHFYCASTAMSRKISLRIVIFLTLVGQMNILQIFALIPGHDSAACMAIAAGGFCTTVCSEGFHEHELLTGCTSPYVCCLPDGAELLTTKTAEVNSKLPDSFMTDTNRVIPESESTTDQVSATSSTTALPWLKLRASRTTPNLLRFETTANLPTATESLWPTEASIPYQETSTFVPETSTFEYLPSYTSTDYHPIETGETTPTEIFNSTIETDASPSNKLQQSEVTTDEEGVVIKDCSFLCKAIILTIMATVTITVLVVVSLAMSGSLKRCC